MLDGLAILVILVNLVFLEILGILGILDSNYTLISTSTPEGNSSFIKASTVLDVEL